MSQVVSVWRLGCRWLRQAVGSFALAVLTFTLVTAPLPLIPQAQAKGDGPSPISVKVEGTWQDPDLPDNGVVRSSLLTAILTEAQERQEEGFNWKDLVLPSFPPLISTVPPGGAPFQKLPPGMVEISRLMEVDENGELILSPALRYLSQIPYDPNRSLNIQWKEAKSEMLAQELLDPDAMALVALGFWDGLCEIFGPEGAWALLEMMGIAAGVYAGAAILTALGASAVVALLGPILVGLVVLWVVVAGVRAMVRIVNGEYRLLGKDLAWDLFYAAFIVLAWTRGAQVAKGVGGLLRKIPQAGKMIEGMQGLIAARGTGPFVRGHNSGWTPEGPPPKGWSPGSAWTPSSSPNWFTAPWKPSIQSVPSVATLPKTLTSLKIYTPEVPLSPSAISQPSVTGSAAGQTMAGGATVGAISDLPEEVLSPALAEEEEPIRKGFAWSSNQGEADNELRDALTEWLQDREGERKLKTSPPPLHAVRNSDGTSRVEKKVASKKNQLIPLDEAIDNLPLDDDEIRKQIREILISSRTSNALFLTEGDLNQIPRPSSLANSEIKPGYRMGLKKVKNRMGKMNVAFGAELVVIPEITTNFGDSMLFPGSNVIGIGSSPFWSDDQFEAGKIKYYDPILGDVRLEQDPSKISAAASEILAEMKKSVPGLRFQSVLLFSASPESNPRSKSSTFYTPRHGLVLYEDAEGRPHWYLHIHHVIPRDAVSGEDLYSTWWAPLLRPEAVIAINAGGLYRIPALQNLLLAEIEAAGGIVVEDIGKVGGSEGSNPFYFRSITGRQEASQTQHSLETEKAEESGFEYGLSKIVELIVSDFYTSRSDFKSPLVVSVVTGPRTLLRQLAAYPKRKNLPELTSPEFHWKVDLYNLFSENQNHLPVHRFFDWQDQGYPLSQEEGVSNSLHKKIVEILTAQTEDYPWTTEAWNGLILHELQYDLDSAIENLKEWSTHLFSGPDELKDTRGVPLDNEASHNAIRTFLGTAFGILEVVKYSPNQLLVFAPQLDRWLQSSFFRLLNGREPSQRFIRDARMIRSVLDSLTKTFESSANTLTSPLNPGSGGARMKAEARKHSAHLHQLGCLLLALREGWKTTKGRSWLERAISLPMPSAFQSLAYYLLAKSSQKEGPQKSALWFRKALQLAPNNLRFLEDCVCSYFQLSQKYPKNIKKEDIFNFSLRTEVLLPFYITSLREAYLRIAAMDGWDLSSPIGRDLFLGFLHARFLWQEYIEAPRENLKWKVLVELMLSENGTLNTLADRLNQARNHIDKTSLFLVETSVDAFRKEVSQETGEGFDFPNSF